MGISRRCLKVWHELCSARGDLELGANVRKEGKVERLRKSPRSKPVCNGGKGERVKTTGGWVEKAEKKNGRNLSGGGVSGRGDLTMPTHGTQRGPVPFKHGRRTEEKQAPFSMLLKKASSGDAAQHRGHRLERRRKGGGVPPGGRSERKGKRGEKNKSLGPVGVLGIHYHSTNFKDTTKPPSPAQERRKTMRNLGGKKSATRWTGRAWKETAPTPFAFTFGCEGEKKD